MTDLKQNPPQTNTPSEGQGAEVSQGPGIDPNFSKVQLDDRGENKEKPRENVTRNSETIIPASESK